jgi:hypothetical protein
MVTILWKMTTRAGAVACALFLCACTTAAPWGAQGTEGDSCFPDQTCDRGLVCLNQVCQAVGGGDDGGLPENDASPQCPVVAPPVLDPVPETTPHEAIAIGGTTGEDAVAVVISEGSQSLTIPVPTRVFCVELPLDPQRTVQFEVAAVDARGCASSPATVTVTQRVDLGRNVLAGLTRPFYSGTLGGSLDRLTDGDTSTSASLSLRDRDEDPDECGDSVYLWYRLPQAELVDRLIVRYGQQLDNADYLRCWALYVNPSPTAELSQPGPGNPDWQEVGGSSRGASSDFLFRFPSPRDVGQLALVMFEDGNFQSEQERFTIAELEALTPSNEAPFEGCP